MRQPFSPTPLLLTLMIQTLPWAAFAQSPATSTASAPERLLPPVTVSGTRGQDAALPLDTASSTTVIDGADIDQGRIEHLGDVAARTANVYLTDMTRTAPQLTIRGHGFSDDESDAVSNPVLIDGIQVYPHALGQLFDLERVEIRRGPQLTGPGGGGGAVWLSSRDPGFRTGGAVQLDYGSGHRRRIVGGVDLPLSASTAVRIAGGYEQADGYVDNIALGRDDTAGWNSRFGRIRLLHRDADGGEWRFGLHQVNTHAGNDYFVREALARQHQSDNSESGRSDTDYTLASGEYQRTLANGRRLLLRLGGYRANWHYWLPSSVYGMVAGQDIGSQAVNGEVQLSGMAGNLDWMFGLHASHIRRDAPFLMDMGAYYRYDLQTRVTGSAAAAFGETGWRFAPGWRLAGGARAEYNQRHLDWRVTTLSGVSQVDASVSDTVLLPRIRLEYRDNRPNLAQFGWLSLARGYKAPGFSYYTSHPESARQPFKAEHGNTLELGWRWADPLDGWALEGTLFQTWLRNQQADELAHGGGSRTANARRSHSRGVELSGTLRPSRTLELTAFAGYLDAAYDDYLDPFDGVDYSGRPFPNAPRHAYGVSMRWQPAAGWEGVLSATRRSTSRLYPADITNPAFTLVDASLNYRHGSWTVGIYGKNLLDKVYYTRASEGVVAAAPRTLGIRFVQEF